MDPITFNIRVTFDSEGSHLSVDETCQDISWSETDEGLVVYYEDEPVLILQEA